MQLNELESTCALPSPAGVASLRITAVSEQSTPSATPRDASDYGSSSSAGTPLVQSLNSSSASLASPRCDRSGTDIAFIVERLQLKPLTGQVVAWAWEWAARLSESRRAPPVSLLAHLWPATEECAAKCTPEDIVDMAEAWAVLTHRWSRHFRFPPKAMTTLTLCTFPAAVKRMSEARLMRLATLCRDIANFRVDPVLSLLGRKGPSARDLMQPMFALVAAEVAWRLCEPKRGVSPETVAVVLTASAAWRWTPVPHCDSMTPGLSSMKEATLEALLVLRSAI